MAFALALAAPAVAQSPHNVLVLYSYGRLLPGNRQVDTVMAETFASRPDLRVAMMVEFLDNGRITGPDYERAFIDYLRYKYAARRPDVLIVAAEEAMDFIHRRRSELFPGVPVVYMAVRSENLRSLGVLPPDIIGTAVDYDFVGTVEQARRWHPKARRLVVVTGKSPWDLGGWEARVRADASRLPRDLELVLLAGLPVGQLQRRLRALPADSIVFTPGFLRDGGGAEYLPREAAELIAAAAPCPVYGPYESFVGTGAVGGHVLSYEAVGRTGAQTAIALLDGKPPSAVNPPAALPLVLTVDWRQLQRWGIADGAVPAGAVVRFRQPSLWEAYRTKVLIGVAVMLFQAALIVALLVLRRVRDRAVRALERSEEHMRLAGQAAGLSTWVYDDDAATASRGARPKRPAEPGLEFVVDFHDVLAQIAPQDRDAIVASLREARDTNGEFRAEYRVTKPDGGLRWEAAGGRVDPSHPHRLLGIAIDVTQRKQAEIEAERDRIALAHMTRVSLLGQLSASIAHQLNQPLASILGNAEAARKMLEREPTNVGELREICDDIIAADDRAAQVIRRLGVLFKRGQPSLEPLDVNEVVRDTLELTRSLLTMRHVSVSTRLAQDLPAVRGDRVQLQQLLLNLIVNATDAMAEVPGGDRVVTIVTTREESAVLLSVTDTGPGVPRDAVGKLFEPFWSTRPGGMGMGLAVCRSIAEAHHGSLEIANPGSAGACFSLRLPLRGTA